MVGDKSPKFWRSATTEAAFDSVFFASVCYHHDFWDKHLHAECSLGASAFLKDMPIQFTKIVKVSYPWKNDGTNACIPNCSGIPPQLMILAEVEHMRN